MVDVVDAVWRCGRKVGRTIYAQLGDQPSDDDVLIGVMDTSGLAARVVSDHNWLIGHVGGRDATRA